MLLLSGLLLVGLSASLLANRVPIVCRYGGALYFPAVVEAVHNLPGGRLVARQSRPFRYPGFDARQELRPDDFAIWPPIRLAPRETSDAILASPSRTHWLGTDEVGRDVAARLLHGATTSLGVGLGAVLVAAAVGTALGALAGYYGGIVDLVISRLTEMVMCFPVFFLLLAILVWLGSAGGAVGLTLVLGLTRWPAIARYVRSDVLRLKHEEFVWSCLALGARPGRIVFRHILPAASVPVLVAMALGAAQVILIEAGLSWLGFGVPAPAPSWGGMLRSGYEHMSRGPHLIYASCAAIFLTVLSCNAIAEGLRRAMNPPKS